MRSPLRVRMVAALLLASGCALAPPGAVVEPWPAAEALFQRDPHWLGGDAAYSVDLGGDRILWLFGDSFVATGNARDRRQSVMVRNTIAIQRGRDPLQAELAFHWGHGAGDRPEPFFKDSAEHGYWPLHGIRLVEGPLLLFQTVVRATPGEGLGFRIDGWRIVRIANPDLPPREWQPTVVTVASAPFSSMMGTAVWRDGDWVVALGTNGDTPHRGLLCRMLVPDLLSGAAVAQWWDGSGFGDARARPGPAVVLADAGPECSLHRDAALGRWVHVSSRGFGATTVGICAAATPHGPWSVCAEVYTPPESKAPGAFVYAAKAHPEVDAGAGWLAITYAANAQEFGDLLTPVGQRELYWPRFLRLRWR